MQAFAQDRDRRREFSWKEKQNRSKRKADNDMAVVSPWLWYGWHLVGTGIP